MAHRRRRSFRRGLAAVAAVGLLSTLAGAPATLAKTTTSKASSPTAKSQCMNNGWRSFKRFKNQGDCVRYVAAAKKKATTTVKSGGPTTTAVAAAKGTIKLGGLYNSRSSSTGNPVVEEAFKIGKAWQAMVNAAGGINGYKVDIVWGDNKGDISRSVQNVKELDQAGVLALAGVEAIGQLSASAKYLNDHKLPVVGGRPYIPEFDFDPMFFPTSTGFFAATYAEVAAARDSGARSIFAGYCIEVSSCSLSNDIYRAASQREGMRYASQAVSVSAIDLTSACLRAKDAGAEFYLNAAGNQANLVRDCSRQNYHPIYDTAGAATQASISASAGERIVGALPDFGVFYEGPETERFRAAAFAAGLGPSSATPATQTSASTWLGFEMAGAVISRLTQANPTRQDFLNALYTVKGENLGGQIAPADYTVQRPGTGLHAAGDCWTEHILKDGKFFHMDKSGQIVSKLTFICGSGYNYVSRPPS
jgi:branched-chain amino acid transport system substrate-binding protein